MSLRIGSHPIPVRAVLGWWLDGARLLSRAPFTLCLLALMPLVVEGLLQLIPLAGLWLSKFLTPMVGAGCFVAAVARIQQRPDVLRLVGYAFAPRRLPRLAGLGLMGLGVFIVQLLLAIPLLGVGVLDWLVLGHPRPEFMNVTSFLKLILPGLLLTSIPLQVAVGLMLFQQATLGEAIAGSLRRMTSAPVAFVLTGLLSTLLVGLAVTIAHGALMLLLVPWCLTTGYVSYAAITGTTPVIAMQATA